MKNLHVLPTDKPTGIFKSGDNLLFSIMNKVRTTHEGFHIYITSDEEAKEGDWGYIPFQGGDVKLVGKYFADDWKKIILTTDQDLINDGVQKIDDDFLQWFVKNPSCEEVDLDTFSMGDKVLYNVVFPKEEQKQHLIDIMRGDEELGLYEEPKQDYSGVHLRHCYQGEYEDGCKYGEDDCPAKPLEEPKQKTLEKLAKEYYPDESKLMEMMERIAFKRGYTECKERMYSEEDMIEFNEWVSLNFPNQHNYLRALQKHNQGLYVPKEKLVGYYSTKELLEQFKKK